MLVRERTVAAVFTGLICLLLGVRALPAQGLAGFLFREQKCLDVRAPEQLHHVPLPNVPNPRTVARAEEEGTAAELKMSLDDALRIALANSEVVRVLSSTGAGSSGRTIYDPAIANTEIDKARAAFDPSLSVGNDFERKETPGPVEAPLLPSRVRIDADGVDEYRMGLEASKKTVTGGTASLSVLAGTDRGNPLARRLNPQTANTVDLEYRQPLLQGGGRRANLAPIMIARIETERSFYQLKSSLQQMVSGVVDAYWALVFARTDLWAREQQVEQNQWALELAEARFRKGLGDAGDVAQARQTLAEFRARLVTARASLLQREAALRNILGIPPSDGSQIVPVSPPNLEWVDTDWQTLLRIAEQYRPDLIELKLILERDEQNLLLARNQSLPQLDATARYRWSHLDGRSTVNGWRVFADPGQFTGWHLGLEVAVPLALSDARAELRQQELIVTRDRANLNQALHGASHDLANSYRNTAQFFEEYRAFKETREAARINLDAQTARWTAGLTIYLNVLQAISAWGNAIDSEAQSLLQYNTELANMHRQTGTILESHGIAFTDEGFQSIGPLGRLFPDHCYPLSRRPSPNMDQYPVDTEPAEQVFELNDLDIPRRRRSSPLPRPRPHSDDPAPPPVTIQPPSDSGIRPLLPAEPPVPSEPRLPAEPPVPDEPYDPRPLVPGDLRGLFTPPGGPELIPLPRGSNE